MPRREFPVEYPAYLKKRIEESATIWGVPPGRVEKMIEEEGKKIGSPVQRRPPHTADAAADTQVDGHNSTPPQTLEREAERSVHGAGLPVAGQPASAAKFPAGHANNPIDLTGEGEHESNDPGDSTIAPKLSSRECEDGKGHTMEDLTQVPKEISQSAVPKSVVKTTAKLRRRAAVDENTGGVFAPKPRRAPVQCLRGGPVVVSGPDNSSHLSGDRLTQPRSPTKQSIDGNTIQISKTRKRGAADSPNGARGSEPKRMKETSECVPGHVRNEDMKAAGIDELNGTVQKAMIGHEPDAIPSEDCDSDLDSLFEDDDAEAINNDHPDTVPVEGTAGEVLTHQADHIGSSDAHADIPRNGSPVAETSEEEASTQSCPTYASGHILPVHDRFTPANLAKDKGLAEWCKTRKPQYQDFCNQEEFHRQAPNTYRPCNRYRCGMTHEDQMEHSTSDAYKAFHLETYGVPVDENKPFGDLDSAVRNGKHNSAEKKSTAGTKPKDTQEQKPTGAKPTMVPNKLFVKVTQGKAKPSKRNINGLNPNQVLTRHKRATGRP
ncbi:unnamed protein product [Periconia digitata]|uniref:Uncharacterized protein n=1 Tax=Periconia digitata TaxID=1303443 RepID=A0A9W4XSV9_9PLEO|nr:unnamed protein product [Periconia digitata]